jgi:hypothetical protein
MHAWYFYVTTANIPTDTYCISTHMGLRIFYEAMMICSNKTFYLSFLNAMLIQKSEYAKVKIIYAMVKVNMDNYRCYLSVRVQIFKSFCRVLRLGVLKSRRKPTTNQASDLSL